MKMDLYIFYGSVLRNDLFKLKTLYALYIPIPYILFFITKVVTSRLSLIMVEQFAKDNDSCCHHHQYSLRIIRKMLQISGVLRNKSIGGWCRGFDGKMI